MWNRTKLHISSYKFKLHFLDNLRAQSKDHIYVRIPPYLYLSCYLVITALLIKESFPYKLVLLLTKASHNGCPFNYSLEIVTTISADRRTDVRRLFLFLGLHWSNIYILRHDLKHRSDVTHNHNSIVKPIGFVTFLYKTYVIHFKSLS